MQHLKARQRKDGHWDYTTTLGERIVPLGYCRAYIDPDEMNMPMHPERADAIRQFEHKHHSHGHATATEACACYKDYLLDQRVSHADTMEMLLKCQHCGEWTHHSVSVDGSKRYILCKNCATRETLEGLFEVGESWKS